MRAVLGLLGWALLAGWLGAQRRVAPARPLPVRPVAQGCPAAVPPVTADSVASASDFVELRRSDCARGCPAYRVRVGGDGSVSWMGDKNVEVKGSAQGSISTDEARALIQRFADRGFWALCNTYVGGRGDEATYLTTLSIAGHSRTVEDMGEGAPVGLRTLDASVDEVAGTHRWRHGAAEVETFGADRLMVDTVSPKVGVTRLMRVAASQQGTTELAGMLADTTVDRNATDSSGWTALMYAAQGGTVEAMTMLLQARADPLRRSNEGESAMFAAVSGVNDPVMKVRVLRAAGVDINGADNRGVTPLMLAARRFLVPGLVATMLDLAADPAKRDVDGRTAMDYMVAQEAVSPDPARYGVARGLVEGALARVR